MYNRYLSGDAYVPLEVEKGWEKGGEQVGKRWEKGGGEVGKRWGKGSEEVCPGSGPGKSWDISGVLRALTGFWDRLPLKNLDTGDILLALIVLFLILEDGDTLDLVITLALVLLFTLGGRWCEGPSHPEE